MCMVKPAFPTSTHLATMRNMRAQMAVTNFCLTSLPSWRQPKRSRTTYKTHHVQYNSSPPLSSSKLQATQLPRSHQLQALQETGSTRPRRKVTAGNSTHVFLIYKITSKASHSPRTKHLPAQLCSQKCPIKCQCRFASQVVITTVQFDLTKISKVFIC